MSKPLSRFCFCVLLSLLVLQACRSSNESNDSATSTGGMPISAEFEDCSYHASGNLVTGSGQGVQDNTIWAPNIISPFGAVKAVARSQVYSPGGLGSSSSDECSAINFEYPHRDTFCERRSADRDSYNCPSRRIHQGIDINAGTRQQCLQLREAKRAIRNGAPADTGDIIPVLAVTDGVVSYVGSYTVDLRPSTGAVTKFRYLHLNMKTLNVEFGTRVKQGDIIGYYSNDFGVNITTLHLHLEVIANVDGIAQYVSPFMSFIQAENRSKNIDCDMY